MKLDQSNDQDILSDPIISQLRQLRVWTGELSDAYKQDAWENPDSEVRAPVPPKNVDRITEEFNKFQRRQRNLQKCKSIAPSIWSRRRANGSNASSPTASFSSMNSHRLSPSQALDSPCLASPQPSRLVARRGSPRLAASPRPTVQRPQVQAPRPIRATARRVFAMF